MEKISTTHANAHRHIHTNAYTQTHTHTKGYSWKNRAVGNLLTI